MARLNSAQATPESYERVIDDESGQGLFSAGGPFESFPGAVLVVGRNGVVLSANDAAGPIAQLVQRGGTVELRDAIDAALAGKAAQINPLFLDQETGGGRPGKNGQTNSSQASSPHINTGPAYDLMALPWADAPAALLLGRDITLDRSLRAALIESRQRYKDLVEASSDFAWETDDQGCFTFVSSGNALGYLASELIGHKAEELLISPGGTIASPFVTDEPIQAADYWVHSRSGEPACVSVVALPLLDAQGVARGARGQCREVTSERRHEQELARSRNRERLFAHILKVVREEFEPGRMLSAAASQLAPALLATGVAVYRRLEDGSLRRVAEAGMALPVQELDPLLDQLKGSPCPIDAVTDCGRLLVRETKYAGESNGALCLWYREPDFTWGEDEDFLIREITAQIAVANQQYAREESLKHLSSTDSLTGLLNRRSFLATLERRFLQATAHRHSLALFYIDLDNFKQVNDSHGHQRGDEVLKKTAAILTHHLRDHDLVARLGGDEFGMAIADLSNETAIAKAESLLQSVTQLREYSGAADHPLGLSVGVAIFDPLVPESLESLMARADAAMYEVKHGGKQGVEVAAPKDADSNDDGLGEGGVQ